MPYPPLNRPRLTFLEDLRCDLSSGGLVGWVSHPCIPTETADFSEASLVTLRLKTTGVAVSILRGIVSLRS